MVALLYGIPRSGQDSGRAGGRDRGLQKQLIGPVPPPLRRRMAGRLPANPPLLPLHDPLRKDETLSEWRRQHWAAHGQLRTAPRAAHEPAGLVGSGRICLLRTDHLGGVEPDQGNAHRRRLPLLVQTTRTLAHRCRREPSTPSVGVPSSAGLPQPRLWLAAFATGANRCHGGLRPSVVLSERWDQRLKVRTSSWMN